MALARSGRMGSTAGPRAATLIAENDGSRLHGRETAPWCRLAIHRVTAANKYRVSIHFHAHPSKEPFQAIREFTHAVEAAAFLITYEPLVAPRELRANYEFQLEDLLRDFDEAVPIYIGSR